MLLSRHLYAIVGLIAILTTVSVSSAHYKGGSPNTQPVVVTNTASNPVQTTVTSLPAVHIASGQSVGISGTPDVTVSSLPDVHIAEGQTVNLPNDASVGINNTTTAPVPVSLDNVNRTPVTFTRDIQIPAGQYFGTTTGLENYFVPAGKRLVIQTVFARAQLYPGEALVGVLVSDIPVPCTDHGNLGGAAEMCDGLASLTYYSAEGAVINLSAQRTGATNNISVTVGFSGYLEPVYE